MKLNAICVMKNEADIVEATLVNAAQFCDNIYIFDNGSTDGTWEIVNRLADTHSNIHIYCQSGEVYRNQLRNRVYNDFYQQFSDKDWWYILDADEILAEDPRPLLQKALKQGKNAMDVWQAQFYFTDTDLRNYNSEDKNLSIPERRRYFKINWREARFFLNDPNAYWPENVSGRIPKRCNKNASQAPVCKHYAERTPEQIAQRRKCRTSNPFSFLHVKNKAEHDWLKSAQTCDYLEDGMQMKVRLTTQLTFALRNAGYWIKWRVQNIRSLARRFQLS